MAGYSGYSMSNNAINAYDNGLVPASKIPGVPAKLVKTFCRYEERHHTSKNYNMTNFYDPEIVLATFGLIELELCAPDPEAVEALQSYRRGSVETFANCTVNWLEWSGSRNHPSVDEMEMSGCTVVVKKQTATIKFPDGKEMRKRLTTRGFSFRVA